MLRMWNYSDTNNCWHYVKFNLEKFYDIPAEHLPNFGIHPKDKNGMHSAHETIKQYFVEKKVNGSIACRYISGILCHVGVYQNGHIYHTMSSKGGVLVEKASKFEQLGKTKYYAHKSL